MYLARAHFRSLFFLLLNASPNGSYLSDNGNERKERSTKELYCEFAYILAIYSSSHQTTSCSRGVYCGGSLIYSEGGSSTTGTIKTQLMTTHQGQDSSQQLNLVLIEKGGNIGRRKWSTNQPFCKYAFFECFSFFSFFAASKEKVMLLLCTFAIEYFAGNILRYQPGVLVVGARFGFGFGVGGSLV